MLAKILLVLALTGLVWGLDQVRYDNYKVYNVRIDDMEQFRLLRSHEKALKVSLKINIFIY